jgi:hypothetical protein
VHARADALPTSFTSLTPEARKMSSKLYFFFMILLAVPLTPYTIGMLTSKLESLYTLRPIGTNIQSIISDENNLNASSAVIVGKKRDRRLLQKISHNQQMRLEALQHQHRKLDELLKENSKSYMDFASLKRLKTKRLRLKDEIERICNQFKLQSPNNGSSAHQLLGTGSYSQVLHGTNLATGRQVAIKIADNHEDLHREYIILDRLKNMKGFVRPHYFGRQDVMNLGCKSVLVMDLLGPSLETLLFATTLGTRGFSSVTVLLIARQLIERLLTLQQYGVVHGDLHSGNLLLGLDSHSASASNYNNRTVYLVDFGCARVAPTNFEESRYKTSYREKLPSIVVDPGSVLGMTGQTEDMSNHHEDSQELDDLKSLVSILFQLYTGCQPSSSIGSDSSVTSFEQMLSSFLPEPLDDDSISCLAMAPSAKLLSEMWGYYQQSLKNHTKIDYNILLTRVDAFLQEEGSESKKNNYYYDWEIQGLHWSSDDGILHHKLYED